MQQSLIAYFIAKVSVVICYPLLVCMVVLIYCEKSYGATIIADYHFDECEYSGTGYEALDTVGGYHAQAHNNVTTESEGQVGRYADLQLYSQAFTPQSTINIGSSWSVSLWFKAPFTSPQRYHVLGAVSGGGDLLYLDKNLGYRWGIYTNSGQIVTGTYQLNGLSSGWHHMALVGTGGRTYLYIDGAYVDSVVGQTTGLLAYIGTSYDEFGTTSAQGFGTAIDEVLVIQGALTSSQVQYIYNNQKNGNNYDGSTRTSSSCGPFVPIAEYRLDECSWDGTTGEVVDSSGNDLHGTAVLSPVSIDVSAESGGVCQAASMGGVSHLAIPDNDLLDISDNLTAMAWVRPDSIPVSGLKTILSKDTNYEYHINSSGQIYWWWNSSGTAYTLTTTTATITPGQWYHIAIKFQTGTATIYINGVPSKSQSGYPVSLDQNSDPLQLGGDYIGERYFAGVIDEVLVFNSPLDDAAVQSIYSAQLNNNNYDGSTRICSACEGLTEKVVISTTDSGGSLGSPFLVLDDADLVNYNIPGKSATLIKKIGDLFSTGLNQVNAAHIDGDGSSYFSSALASMTLEGLNIMPGDILKYDPSSGLISKFLDGGSHFSNDGEIIDALFLLDNGSFILSTAGVASLGGLTFQDEDLVEYNPTTRAASLYFDGSSHFTADEDINGVHIIDSTRLLLTTETDAQLGALSFRKGDIALYAPTPKVASIFFEGAAEFGSVQNIDSLTTAHDSVMIDHYEIVHDGAGLTCSPEDVQIVACLTSDCSTLSLAEATLSLSPAGWVDGDDFTFTSSIDLQLRHTAAETVTVAINDPVPVAVNGYKCVNAIGGDGVSCEITFSDSGFSFSVPTQVSGKTSTDITITAVKKDDTTVRCVPAFSERSETIDFWSTYLSPASGTYSLEINGTSIAANSPGTGISLAFDTNGQATFTLLYEDAGQLDLNSRFEGSGDEVGLVMTGNSNFVVHPAGLCVYSDDTDSDCSPASGSCSAFVAAGKPFTLKVKGVGWESDTEVDTDFCDTNPLTPNYQHSGIVLSHSLIAPGTGVAGAIDIGLAAVSSGGEVELSQIVSEVGVFTFTADPPADYLGAGDVFGGTSYTSGNIGRFRPDHFELSILPDPPVFAESCLVYTYLGESFDYQLVPDLNITAMNGAEPATITENYEGDFFKVATDLNYSYLDNNVPVAASPLTPVTSSQLISDTVDCGGTVTITLVEDDGISGNGVRDGFNYTRPTPDNPVAPYVPDVTMTIVASEITDSDGVCFDSGSGCQDFQATGITGVNLRHGRSLGEPVFGPETDSLVMPVSTFWYDGSDWQVNSDDDCSVFDYSLTASGLVVTSLPLDPVTLSAGEADLTLTPNAASNRGTVTVDFDFPSWLEPDPSAVATFGIARGNDRILNWQEIMR